MTTLQKLWICFSTSNPWGYSYTLSPWTCSSGHTIVDVSLLTAPPPTPPTVPSRRQLWHCNDVERNKWKFFLSILGNITAFSRTMFLPPLSVQQMFLQDWRHESPLHLRLLLHPFHGSTTLILRSFEQGTWCIGHRKTTSFNSSSAKNHFIYVIR